MVDPGIARAAADTVGIMQKGGLNFLYPIPTEQDFREFTFTNVARLHTRNNPDFFKGTVVERSVADELGLMQTSR